MKQHSQRTGGTAVRRPAPVGRGPAHPASARLPGGLTRLPDRVSLLGEGERPFLRVGGSHDDPGVVSFSAQAASPALTCPSRIPLAMRLEA